MSDSLSSVFPEPVTTNGNKPQIGRIYETFDTNQPLQKIIQDLYTCVSEYLTPEAKELFFKIEKLSSDCAAIPLNVHKDILSGPFVSFLNDNGIKATLILFAIGNYPSNGEGLILIPEVIARTESFLYIGFTFSFDLTLIICFEDCPSTDIISDDFINDVLRQVSSHICNWRSNGGSHPILCALLFKAADKSRVCGPKIQLMNIQQSNVAISQPEKEPEEVSDLTFIEEAMTSLVICPHCTYSSPDDEICQRCRRPFFSEPLNDSCSDTFSYASSDQDDVTQSSTRSSPKKKSSSQSSDCSSNESSPSKSESGRERHRRRCTKKNRKPKSPSPSPPPVDVNEEEAPCFVLSSDEEDSISQASSGSSLGYPPPVTNVFSKEPTVEELSAPLQRDPPMRGGGVDMDRLLDSRDVERISVSCRTVRFGSYKMVPQDRIFISENGLKITLPGSHKKNPHIVRIMMKDIVKVLIHFGNSENSAAAPAIFYYVNIHAGSRIKDFLNKMTDSKEEIFFDPASKDELHKRITLLPEIITNEERLFLKSIYETRCLLEEITWEEANDILVRAAPKEVQHTLKKEVSKHNPTTSNNLQRIMIYPPPPSKGGIPINTEDYACLKEDQFLNDVIIDFYLKYLYLNVLNEEEKKRTHIFSSFFYKRLTNAYQDPKWALKLSAADRRHARVKSWTKTVDIFEKDFIIIPINERSHWFLGIICFPGLTGPVRMSDNTPILPDNKPKDSSVLAGGQVPAKIWGTTISLVKPEQSPSVSVRSNSSIVVENEDDDLRDEENDIRDEAEADDEDMEPNTTDEESLHEDDLLDEATPRSSKQKAIQEPIKQPCILIFDSLACASRSRVCATLREYLAVEWKVRHKGKYRDFSKDVFKGAVPKVPQQTNFIDCGVYVLQYVDSFFKNPITDYRMPIKSIKQWFTTDEVNRKRFEIMQLLLNLMREQNIDIESLNLPNLNLCAYPMFDGDDDDEVLEDQEYDDDALMDADEEPIEEEEAEEEEEEEDDNEAYDILDERLKAKRYNISAKQRIEAISKYEISPSIRLEPQTRIERIETRHSPRRFDTPSPRHERGEGIRSSVEQARPEPVTTTTTPLPRQRLPDSVTICEANSKRKLPLSLKDIRNPRQSSSSTSSQQATIEKVKRMKVD